MATFVICKNCNENFFTDRPSGNVQASGNVRYSGVQFDGSSIKFGSGGKLDFGKGGQVSFGNPKDSKIRCPKCDIESIYDLVDFIDE